MRFIFDLPNGETFTKDLTKIEHALMLQSKI